MLDRAGYRAYHDRMDDKLRETTSELAVKYDDRGLIAAVVTDAASGQVLMLAWMNAEALARTRSSGLAHFWSRSRQSLWQKGESSGNMLRVKELRIDCDQDALWIIAEPAGPACHTGQISCFYRRLTENGLEQL
jgi:phosphoribosyl-AMP cyclohydrolase